MLEEADNLDDKRRYFKRIYDDLDEMQSLVETLLRYSGLDEFELRLVNERIELCQFIPDFIANANSPNVVVTTYFSAESVIVHSDPKYLGVAMFNIFSNATKYAESKVDVRVSHNQQDSKKMAVSLTVEDNGVGIPEDDRAHVIKPFWRG